MDINCLLENVSISGLSELTNDCAKRNSNIYKKQTLPDLWLLCKLKLTHFAIDNQDSSIILGVFELKVHLIS